MDNGTWGRYDSSLRKYMASAGGPGRMPLRGAGLGRKMLWLAKAHERSASARGHPQPSRARSSLADAFFAHAILGMIDTSRLAGRIGTRLETANDEIRRQTRTLAATQTHLQRVIGLHVRAEADLAKCREHYARLKSVSNRLQRGLRLLTHQVLGSQEAQRSRIGRQLRDGIGQTLIGINMRLLALKRSSEAETADITRGIASVQRATRVSIVTAKRSIRQARTT